MRPAGGFGNTNVRIKRLGPTVAIRLQDPLERDEMRPRVLALAIRRVAVEHRRRIRAAERAVIPDIGPEPRLPGPTAFGLEQRHGGVVGVEAVRAHDLSRERVE